MKKIAIVGSRSLHNNHATQYFIASFIDSRLRHYKSLEIVSGGCPTGPDAIAEGYIEIVIEDMLLDIYHDEYDIDLMIEYKEFPADWDKLGKAAGPIRNEQIVKYSDSILICWDGKSRGSKTVIDFCVKYGKDYFVKLF